MARSSDPLPALVAAAQELEDELRRCEEAAVEAAKIRLTSEKHFTRAARALKTAADHRDNLGAKVNALLAAINSARARADEAAARMESRAGEIQTRMAKLQTFQERSGEIAAAVRDLTAVAKTAQTPKDILDRLPPVEERIAAAQQEAKEDDFEDVAHDLAALKEMLATMRRKLEGR